MEAISLETTKDKYLITVDKDTVKTEFIVRLIERLRIEHLAEKVNFNADIEQLGEEIKDSWWNNNKNSLLGQMK